MRVVQNHSYSTQPIDFNPASDIQYFALGTVMTGAPADPTYVGNAPNGCGRFIYARSLSAVVIGAPVQLDKDFNVLPLANAGNTGAPVNFAASLFSATNQYGWVASAGQVPVKVSAATAAGPLFISGVGTVAGTVAAGKQILGASALIGSTGAFTKAAARTRSASLTVKVPDVAGLYCGLTVSGTGIPATTVIAYVDAGRNEITLSNAATASGAATLTFTHTGYVIAAIASPFVQGQIT